MSHNIHGHFKWAYAPSPLLKPSLSWIVNNGRARMADAVEAVIAKHEDEIAEEKEEAGRNRVAYHLHLSDVARHGVYFRRPDYYDHMVSTLYPKREQHNGLLSSITASSGRANSGGVMGLQGAWI